MSRRLFISFDRPVYFTGFGNIILLAAGRGRLDGPSGDRVQNLKNSALSVKTAKAGLKSTWEESIHLMAAFMPLNF